MNNAFSNIPDELKAVPRWVNWRFVLRAGKPTKIPINPHTRRNASCKEPTTWGTFEQAVARLGDDFVSGIGFELGPPYAGVDLDVCRDPGSGVVEEWARKIIAALNSYSEISPSGRGVKILVRAVLPQGGRRKGHVELYDSSRFFTITGNHFEGTPPTIEARQAEVEDLHAQIFGKNEKEHPEPHTRQPLTDDEILALARNGANGEKFSRLWRGDISGYRSQSEADLALCAILAFRTERDANRIDQLFRRSSLFRSKWDARHSAGGRSYGQLTIEKAIEGTAEVRNQPIAASSGGGTDKQRPTILYSNRQLDDVTHEALGALRASNSPPELFVRSGQIVRVRVDEEDRPIIDIVGESELRSRVASVSDAVMIGKSGPRNCYPSRDVIQNLLALGKWPFPALQAIVEAPVLRPDGTIFSTPGYDAETRLVYAPAPGLDMPEIPDEPTDLDVADSVDILEETIGEFPFADGPSKANAIATILTPVVRPAIKGKTPLALIDAPQMGTGKGLLSEVVGLIATGREAAMMAAPKDEEEWRKRITANLLTGASIITIDNVEGELNSAALAAVLTAREWSDRILGLSKMVRLPVRATWIASGNNIRVGGDLARRCYWTRLDAKTSRPWKRTGFTHPDLLIWVSQHRGEILAAVLTLIRAWFAAGKPDFEVPAVGGFDEWARIVGGVLGFAGVTGFLRNLDALYDTADESFMQWESFLEVLASIFNDEPFTVKKLVDRLQSESRINEALPDEVAYEREGDTSLQRRLGKAFSKREGRRYGDADIHLQRSGMESRAVKWRVVRG